MLENANDNTLLSDAHTESASNPPVTARDLEKISSRFIGIVITLFITFVCGQLFVAIWDLNSKISTVVGQSIYRDRIDEAARQMSKKIVISSVFRE